jgi:CRISPR-associated exonuclease Cas4
MVSLIFLAVFILLLAALILAVSSRAARKRSGIPEGRILHADSEKRLDLRKTFFSPRLMLAGRPDAVLVDGGWHIPVEIKIREPPENPFESHIMQLAAYCFLLEEAGYRVREGVLVYKGKKVKEFRIPYTDELKARLILIVDEMRRIGGIPPRIHSRKCETCSVREHCTRI